MVVERIGFTCGSFDLLHAGHCLMLEEASQQCDFLIVGLQTDPSIDRPEKNKPVQALEERLIQLRAIKYIGRIVCYDTEADLYDLLQELSPDVRILGADWEGKEYTGHDLDIPVYFNRRDHDYSTTELRLRIKKIS